MTATDIVNAASDTNAPPPPTEATAHPQAGGLALTTVLPTPTGWTTVGAVEPGDQLLDATGHPCTVTHASAMLEQDCREVVFEDGNRIVCSTGQVWPTLTGQKAEAKQLTASWIGDHLRNAQGSCTHRVLNAAPVVLPDRDLPIHPYVLGAWLGDGKHTSGEITKGDEELFELLAACGYTVGPDIGGKDHCRSSTVYGLRTQVRLAGLLANKHVPDVYLRASAEQRLALLQGLMDTDGTWNRVRKQAVFTNTSKVLAHSVVELVHSLGAKARLWEVQAKGFGLTVTCYHVTFSPVAFNPFRLSRKAELVRDARTMSLRRVIVASDATVLVPTRALSVDSPHGTFLCGEGMIPTCQSEDPAHRPEPSGTGSDPGGSALRHAAT